LKCCFVQKTNKMAILGEVAPLERKRANTGFTQSTFGEYHQNLKFLGGSPI
jgi:hypothetical protein